VGLLDTVARWVSSTQLLLIFSIGLLFENLNWFQPPNKYIQMEPKMDIVRHSCSVHWWHLLRAKIRCHAILNFDVDLSRMTQSGTPAIFMRSRPNRESANVWFYWDHSVNEGMYVKVWSHGMETTTSKISIII
jgi:hypothetical protein